MRIIKSIKETTSMKQTLFRDLVQECQLSTPESSLSEKIKRKIGEIGKAELKDVVAQTEEGCAPLFLACKNGSAEVVEYLLSICCADIEQRGKFEVAEEAVSHSVTPLWCAAVAGRLSVVKVSIFCGVPQPPLAGRTEQRSGVNLKLRSFEFLAACDGILWRPVITTPPVSIRHMTLFAARNSNGLIFRFKTKQAIFCRKRKNKTI